MEREQIIHDLALKMLDYDIKQLKDNNMDDHTARLLYASYRAYVQSLEKVVK